VILLDDFTVRTHFDASFFDRLYLASIAIISRAHMSTFEIHISCSHV
jgi:hypothetical protein